MLEMCKTAKDRETGGILIGNYSPDLHTASITQATCPPRDSTGVRFWFSRGISGVAKLLRQLWHQEHYYLGEWHFHPGASSLASSTDDATMIEIAKSPSYQCSKPILIIVGQSASSKFEMSCYVYSNNAPRIELEEVEKI